MDGVVNNEPLSLLVDTGARSREKPGTSYAQKWITDCSRGVNGGSLGEKCAPSGVWCHRVGA